MNKKWSMFLTENYCQRDSETGNRPCDNGFLCDSCMTSYAQEKFEEWSKTHKIPAIVVYYFETNNEEGTMFQSVFNSQADADKFIVNYGSGIEVFDVRQEYR